MTRAAARPYAVLLAVLATLFLLRVAGQALVAFAGTPGLPPMGEWYSGLLPYPLLLPAQALILAVQGWICVDFARGEALPPRRAPLARWLARASYVYAGAMAVRYGVTMALHPERGGSARHHPDRLPLGAGRIPVHLLARFHTRR